MSSTQLELRSILECSQRTEASILIVKLGLNLSRTILKLGGRSLQICRISIGQFISLFLLSEEKNICGRTQCSNDIRRSMAGGRTCHGVKVTIFCFKKLFFHRPKFVHPNISMKGLSRKQSDKPKGKRGVRVGTCAVATTLDSRVNEKKFFSLTFLGGIRVCLRSYNI